MKAPAFLSAAFLPFLFSSANAQSVIGEPVGVVTVRASANADTPLSLPLARYAVSGGTVKSLAGSTLTVLTQEPLVAGSLTQTEAHYIRFSSGAGAGRHFTITANTSDSITFDWNGESVVLAEGDKFSISPYWSLGAILSPDDAGRAFIVSRSPRDPATVVLLRRGDGAGNHEAFYFFEGAWRKFGAQPEISFNSYPVHPDASLVVRNKGEATSIALTGQLSSVADKVVINALGGGERKENELNLSFPGPIALGRSNLVESGAFEPSASPERRRDELRVYSGSVAGMRHVATYYHCNGAWRKVGASASASFDAESVFSEGTRVVLSKAGTGGEPLTVYWTQPTLALN